MDAVDAGSVDGQGSVEGRKAIQIMEKMILFFFNKKRNVSPIVRGRRRSFLSSQGSLLVYRIS